MANPSPKARKTGFAFPTALRHKIQGRLLGCSQVPPVVFLTSRSSSQMRHPKLLRNSGRTNVLQCSSIEQLAEKLECFQLREYHQPSAILAATAFRVMINVVAIDQSVLLWSYNHCLYHVDSIMTITVYNHETTIQNHLYALCSS